MLTRCLQWAVDDERLKPRERRERHPIADDPPAATIEALVREVHVLKVLQAQAWDQVWWLSLPRWRRVAFRLLGFRAPVQRFYLRPGDPWPR